MNVRQYEMFELRLNGISGAGPVLPEAVTFRNGEKTCSVPAFLAGETFRVRFMPETAGTWEYTSADGSQSGTFTCTPEESTKCGPVRAEEDHFRYAGGSMYRPFGTTVYAAVHQSDALLKETEETLAEAPFNKIRFLVFPKFMPYNREDPEYYPFFLKDGCTFLPGETQGGVCPFDVTRPDERYWTKLDGFLTTLRKQGIEADLILFHPYDRWGLADMTMEECLLYLRYCIARLGAYSNLWWSLANEYEMLGSRGYTDWDAFGTLLAEEDPYHHLISIHNIIAPYEPKKWMTHLSMQSGEIDRIPLWKAQYGGMPVLIDECGYEGDIMYDWGNLTAEEMVHRFWWSVCRGGYCTHGETFHREDEVLWWGKGGKLHGKSAEGIAFLRSVLEETGEDVLRAGALSADDPNGGVPENPVFARAMRWAGEMYRERVLMNLAPMRIAGERHVLQYLGHHRPLFTELALPEEGSWKVERIDTLKCTRETVLEAVSGTVRVELTGEEQTALLATRTA